MRSFVVRIRNYTLTALIALLSACAPASIALSIEEQASQVLAGHDFTKTLEIGRECLRQNPDSRLGKWCVVVAGLNGTGSLDDVESTLKAMHPRDYTPGLVSNFWGILEWQRGNYPKALAYSKQTWQETMGQKRSTGECFYHASRYEKLGQHDQALIVLTQSPELAGLKYFESGQKTGDLTTAVAAVEKVYKEGQFDQALWLLSKVPLQKLNLSGLTLLALTYEANKRMPDAKKVRNMIVQKHAGDSQAMLSNAEWGIVNHDYEFARRCLSAVKGKPEIESKSTYWAMQANISTRSGDNKAAEQAISKAIELEPDNADYYDSRRFIRGYLGQKQESLQDLDKLVELEPAKLSYRKERAAFEIKERMYAKALSDYDYLCAHSDGNQKARYLLGKAKLQDQLGDLRAAFRTVNAAQTIDRSNMELDKLKQKIAKEAELNGIDLSHSLP